MKFLDLTGLVVTLTKSDSSTENVAFADFGTKGITTVKADGDTLNITDTEVVINVNGKTVNQAITVIRNSTSNRSNTRCSYFELNSRWSNRNISSDSKSN